MRKLMAASIAALSIFAGQAVAADTVVQPASVSVGDRVGDAQGDGSQFSTMDTAGFLLLGAAVVGIVVVVSEDHPSSP